MNGEKGLTLVTGGAGFVGCNLAQRLLGQGQPVVILDNLSRPGVERNIAWLQSMHGDRLTLRVGDVRDSATVHDAMDQVQRVFHFAAQVAVTTSLLDPMEDFAVNAQGTLNVLEAARRQHRPPSVIMTSTNKVYGNLADVALRSRGQRYEPLDPALAASGIDERRPLDFHSPYGCSKGAADQYVLDYAHSYGLRTLVFRMSCIYGPRQFGTEDQGWVAHFLLRALQGRGITLFGDGLQVRDILFVDDLVDALLLADEQIEHLSGHAFNIGGGVERVVSLLDVIDTIEALKGRRPALTFEDWRTGDQRYYVSDTRSFQQATGWHPRTPVPDGLARLYEWLRGRHQAEAVVAGDVA